MYFLFFQHISDRNYKFGTQFRARRLVHLKKKKLICLASVGAAGQGRKRPEEEGKPVPVDEGGVDLRLQEGGRRQGEAVVYIYRYGFLRGIKPPARNNQKR